MSFIRGKTLLLLLVALGAPSVATEIALPDQKLVGRIEALSSFVQAAATEKKRENRTDSTAADHDDDEKPLAAPVEMTEANGFDPLGPWFEGVVNLGQERRPSAAQVGAAKNKTVGIVGAGLAGLMTFLVLHQAGFERVHMLEANRRLGGRVHTTYLSGGPADYSYQEMGPMRFPLTYVDPDSGRRYDVAETHLVTELIRELNALNGNSNRSEELAIRLIDWIEHDENGLQYFGGVRLPSGLPPTKRQVEQDPSLSPSSSSSQSLSPETRKTRDLLRSSLPGSGFRVQMAQNMYKAHREWVTRGLDGGAQPGDRWSEFAFISRHLNGSLNDTALLTTADDAQSSFWITLNAHFRDSADTYATVDGGLARIPLAFAPLVRDRIRFNASVDRISWREDKKLALQWHRTTFDDDDDTPRRSSSSSSSSSVFDYAVVSAPFTVVRGWRLPTLGATITSAIRSLVYSNHCKVALEFASRFWQRNMSNPIRGGCSTNTDIPGIGEVCYPSYNNNNNNDGNSSAAARPASILGSYLQGWPSPEVSSFQLLSDAEHVGHVLDALGEMHGHHLVRSLYTGKWARKCWGLDRFAVGAIATPAAGQHELYLPEYFKLHKNIIFVGEHTSYSNGWVWSSLDSGIRGAVQLMLELGLVDEAKAAVNKWMAPWLEV